MRFFTVFLASAMASVAMIGIAMAAPVPPAARTEIEALLTKLQVSQCEFNRNGTWHASIDAKNHLLRKLEYVEKNATITTAEQFIQQAATASSMSGKPYQVRCSGAVQPSSSWLLAQLQVIRSTKNADK
jgi:hypothetical protein